jgi:Domain of unknown function (DUF4424)
MPTRNVAFLSRALRKIGRPGHFSLVLACMLVISETAGSPALSNDGVAEIGAGGLEFTSNSNVEMAEEDLRIAVDKVDVRYLFRNRSTEAQTLLVAFPLPALFSEWFSEVPDERLIGADPLRYIAFETKVDGVTVQTEVEQKADVLNIDVTQVLTDVGIPLYPGAPDMAAKLANLPGAKLEALITRGAVERSGTTLVPRWQYKVTYFWRQTFLPDKPVEITHSYRPIVGGSVPYDTFLDDFAGTYCIGDSFRAAYDTTKDRPDRPGFAWINYILTTAGTWAGPIGKFKLTVEKPDAAAAVALCREGMREVGPTTLEWTAEGFRPQEDLDILMLTR